MPLTSDAQKAIARARSHSFGPMGDILKLLADAAEIANAATMSISADGQKAVARAKAEGFGDDEDVRKLLAAVAEGLAAGGGGGGGGTNATNLTLTRTPTSVTVVSDTGTDALIPVPDATNAGVFLAAEKTKLAGVAAGATANAANAFLLDRVNHTGVQAMSTITGLAARLASVAAVRSYAGAADTFILADAGAWVRSTGAAAVAQTVPTNATVAFPVGTILTLRQAGAGAVTLGGAGVTLNGDKKTAGANKTLQLVKVATDTWDVTGGVA